MSSSARWPRASGRRSGRNAARRSTAGSRSNGSPARDLTEAHWDAFFDFYMDTGSRKWGSPYLNAGILQPARRDAWPTGSTDARQARRAARRRCAQCDRRRRAIRPLLGRASRITPSSISRSATTRPSSSPSPTGSRGSRPARKGEHKLARGYLPSETYSAHYIADRACAAPWPITSSASGARCPRHRPPRRGVALSQWRRANPRARMRSCR